MRPTSCVVGLHTHDPAALGLDSQHVHAGPDRDPALSGTRRQRPGERCRVDPAIGRQIGGALDTFDRHQGEQIARLPGRDQGQRQPECARPADLAPKLEQALLRRRQSQASHLAPARIEPRVVAQPSIELDARHVDAGQRDRRAKLADEPRRVEGRTARQLTPVEHEDVVAPGDRQVVRDAAAGDAAADDDDAGGIDGRRLAIRR